MTLSDDQSKVVLQGVGRDRMDWENHLDSLIVWALERGYYVDFVANGDDCICHISKLIEINSSSPIEKQVIHLAHECGHALTFDNGSSFDLHEKREYPKYTVAYKVFTVIEEIEAWKRGRDLLKRLQIPMDDETWEKSMVKALKKYINWASDLREEKNGKQKNVDEGEASR